MQSDLRLRDYIGQTNKTEGSVDLIGFPSDEGVKINAGRPGASSAPDLIFEQLMKLTPHPAHKNKHTALLKSISSPHIMTCSGRVDSDQKKLAVCVSDVLSSKKIPVILGGGHETSFGHFLGYAHAGMNVHIVNIDAHTDVRPLKDGKAHSGSPFLQALEHPFVLCKSYHVYGLNPATVSDEHVEYVKKHGTARFENEFCPEDVTGVIQGLKDEHVMVTMDMDVVSQGDAPGVSAPNASGISKERWLELAFELGRQQNVTSFDLCEVNPEYDRDGQTVKLAALTVWYFLLGVALR